MNDKGNNKLEPEQQNSIWNNLGNEWKLYISLFLKPLSIIPVVLFLLSFYYANATDITDKRFSLSLNAFAAVALAVAGGFLYDAFKSLTGDTILIKKGLSAVRNLSLARGKTKNIINRAKESASTEEIKNLLGLLEKDIANATQEWNDILPGVDRKEEIYKVLAEKENELEIAQKQLESEKELGEVEKERLRKEILRLSQDISRLQLTASSTPVSGESRLVRTLKHGDFADTGAAKTTIAPTLSQFKACSKCGKPYIEYDTSKLFIESICQDCRSTG